MACAVPCVTILPFDASCGNNFLATVLTIFCICTLVRAAFDVRFFLSHLHVCPPVFVHNLIGVWSYEPFDPPSFLTVPMLVFVFVITRSGVLDAFLPLTCNVGDCGPMILN